MKTSGSNRLIMIALIYAKLIIHLSGHQTIFLALHRLILVLGQKGDLTTRYPKIIWHARLPLKYTKVYLFSAMNLIG